MMTFEHKMGFTYLIEKRAKKGMMVLMIRNGILKLNHLLFDELFNMNKTHSPALCSH
jgi:hypothetical protein